MNFLKPASREYLFDTRVCKQIITRTQRRYYRHDQPSTMHCRVQTTTTKSDLVLCRRTEYSINLVRVSFSSYKRLQCRASTIEYR